MPPALHLGPVSSSWVTPNAYDDRGRFDFHSTSCRDHAGGRFFGVTLEKRGRLRMPARRGRHKLGPAEKRVSEQAPEIYVTEKMVVGGISALTYGVYRILCEMQHPEQGPDLPVLERLVSDIYVRMEVERTQNAG